MPAIVFLSPLPFPAGIVGYNTPVAKKRKDRIPEFNKIDEVVEWMKKLLRDTTERGKRKPSRKNGRKRGRGPRGKR
jgi:hypothetical protein